MSEDLRLRRYQLADYDRVIELHERALQDVGAYAENAGSFERDLETIPETYLHGGEFLVGVAGGHVVAMGGLRPVEEATAECKRFRVDPDHQRQGYGEKILRTLEESARDEFERIILDTTARQIAAQALFRKLGYSELRREQWDEFEMVFFEKQLD